MHVSRETGIWLESLGADTSRLLTSYAELLAGDGVRKGLLGPREASRVWDRHISNCAPLISLLPRDARVADLGSGAGLPGLVLAILRPDVSVTAVEPQLRRTEFLQEAIRGLGLGNVRVERGRAESLGADGFDVVTSRALAPVDRLLAWSLPLCADGGVVLAIKGASAFAELERYRSELADLGTPELDVIELESFVGDTPTTVLRCSKRAVGEEGAD